MRGIMHWGRCVESECLWHAGPSHWVFWHDSRGHSGGNIVPNSAGLSPAKALSMAKERYKNSTWVEGITACPECYGGAKDR